MTTKQLPYTEPDFKIAGYTGYIQGLQETYKKTPIPCQIECQEPTDESFIFTRTRTGAKTTPNRDPCNSSELTKKPQPGNLWPKLQPCTVQKSLKPPRSNITLGDLRIDPFKTSYQVDFDGPFEESKHIRSPMRNKDLEKSEISLKRHYKSAYDRVGEERLLKMIARMRERLEAKLANANNNAFKMRKLFKMYDKEQSGLIQLEDVRMMTESFGMQLDDDSLLALFSMYDPDGTGYMRYQELMMQLLDPDYYALYVGNVDNTQQHVDHIQTTKMMETMVAKFKQSPEDMQSVFLSFDNDSSNVLGVKDFCAACAILGVVLTEKELNHVLNTMGDAGKINYMEFLKLWC